MPASTARRDIQGLRAIAVLAVVSAHALGWPQGGFVGVDVFFVISGFLITGMLVRELTESGRVSLRSFYARRARRILPAAVVTIVVAVAAGFVVFNVVRAHQTLWDGVWALLLASNWHFAAVGTDYFQASGAISPLQNFWSLSVEEQFYLVWPGLLLVLALLLPAAARRGRGIVALVGILAALVTIGSFGWAVVQSAAEPTLAYFSTFTRAWEFAAGALLVVVLPLLAALPRSAGAAMSWIGTGAILVSLFVIDPTAPGFPGPWAALPVAATVLALAGGASARPRAVFGLTNPVSVFVGDMSYSLYLWHFPVIVFAAVLVPPSPWRVWIVLGAIAVMSLASYLIVEQPLRYSPLLGGRAPSAGPSPSPRTEVTKPAPSLPQEPPAASVILPARSTATRPAGWTPGQRYYPGSARGAGAGRAPVGAGVSVSEPLVEAHSSTPAPIVDDAAAVSPTPAEAWRRRFGAQIAFATSGLVVVAVATALALQFAPGAPAAGAGHDGAPAVADVADEAATLQADLAAAVAATQWPELSPSMEQVMAATSEANPARDCYSPTVTPDPSGCTWGSGDAPVRLYLVGDSIAMAYAPAFRKLADDSAGQIRVTTVGLYGCRFTDVLVQNDGAGVMAACAQRKADVAAMIAADQPDLVVMANAYALGHTPDGRGLSAQELIASEQAEAARYGMPGRVVYLAPPPEGASLGVCFAPSTSPGACAVGVSPTWQEMQAATVTGAAASGDHTLDSLPFTCWQGVCPAFAGTLPIRYDQTHLSVAYAEHIAPYLRSALSGIGPLT